jgi:hypothetical protein
VRPLRTTRKRTAGETTDAASPSITSGEVTRKGRQWRPPSLVERVLGVYISHYNSERPHRGLALRPPEAPQLKPPPAVPSSAATASAVFCTSTTEPQPE